MGLVDRWFHLDIVKAIAKTKKGAASSPRVQYLEDNARTNPAGQHTLWGEILFPEKKHARLTAESKAPPPPWCGAVAFTDNHPPPKINDPV